jgi:hypothetical protein
MKLQFNPIKFAFDWVATASDLVVDFLKLDQTTPQSITGGNASVIEPTSDLHIANKYYVDSNVDLDGGFANSVYLISQISDGGGA